MSMLAMIALVEAGLLIGCLSAWFLPNVCWHRWERWKEVQGLLITTYDEWGGKSQKEYRRFERTCTKCGKTQLRKKRDG